jgi:hypothetical protein
MQCPKCSGRISIGWEIRLQSSEWCGQITLVSGTKSGPKGSCTEDSVDSTLHTPRNSSGKYKSDGPPPTASQARSNAGGSLLACKPHTMHNGQGRWYCACRLTPDWTCFTKRDQPARFGQQAKEQLYSIRQMLHVSIN